MKKIVFVTPQIKTGGGNRVFFELANILVKEYDVKIVYPNNSLENNTFSIDQRIKFKAIGKFESNKIGKIINIASTFLYLNKYEKKAHIVTSDPIMSIFGFLLLGKLKYRFVQADDYNIFNDGMIIPNKLLLNLYKKLTKFSFKFNYSFIFNSNYSYRKFCEQNLTYKKDVKIVHPAINHFFFNSLNRPSLEKDKIQLCLVARKHPLKGLQTFIDSWKYMPAIIKEKVGKVVLISHDDLIGFDTSEFTIIRPNSDHDIVKEYLNADIFISTSWSEGFGLPPLEAMACGCAVITSDSGGVSEFAINNENCLMFLPGDYKSLQLAIEQLINDKQKMNQFQINGVETAKLFSWNSSAKKMIEIFNSSDNK
ncbi:glycosyltransferase family 4 protein [Flavobacterium aquidurense]|uniref:glycosyltransferase family 4 protein n=1 Tax=Flavobacterium aquidurense TaxID=362413 RepID=UPI00371D15A5